jgi:DNA-binding response OmpR family regulator
MATMSEQAEDLRLKNAKVLIVDDDQDVLDTMIHAFRAEGANTLKCMDGNTAVRLCDSEKPDIIILDMMLPKRSGFLVLERIRAGEVNPIVIMVTANEGKRHQQYAEALGVEGYMLKPVRLERLITLSQELIEKRDDDESE